jgi:uncharacterized protein (DUF305 family)
MLTIIIILLLLLIIFYLFIKKEEFKNICTSKLSDIEYLEHMIPHHQVAIDISRILQAKTNWPELQQLLRELIWTQELEIEIMYLMLDRLPNRISDNKVKMNKLYVSTFSDFIKPNKLGLTNVYCDPIFFNPKEHMKHLSNINDDSYFDHMIPHHQVAVDMSKILLQNTNNDMMIWLAYRIIKNQQHEIIILDNLRKSIYKYQSNLIVNKNKN